jgi:hypothetical protein
MTDYQILSAKSDGKSGASQHRVARRQPTEAIIDRASGAILSMTSRLPRDGQQSPGTKVVAPEGL